MNGYKPTYLRLKGFTGIKRGLGIDEIEISLSELHGLIAISGDNGRGKSTVLECLLPFPEFISKESTHLADNVFKRDGEWELHFDYLESKYKIYVKIDNHSRKIEGYIWKNEEPQVNGKISEYKKYIINLLGSANMAYNSIFCAQNSKKISELTEGDIRTLFREFVGADKLEEMSKTAGELKKYFKYELERERSKLSYFDNLESDIQVIKENLKTTEEQKLIIKDNMFNLGCYIKENSCCISHIKNQIYKSDVKKIEKENIEKKLNELRSSLEQNKNEKSEHIFNLIRDIGNKKLLCEDYKKIIKGKDNLISLKNDLFSNQESIKNHESFSVNCNKEIVMSDSRIECIKIDLDKIYTKKERLQDELNDLKDIYTTEKNKYATLESSFQGQSYNKEIQTHLNKIQTINAQIKPLENRPENCVDNSCSFIKAALLAEKKLIQCERDLKDLENKKKTTDAALLAEINIQIKSVHKAEENIINKKEEFKPILQEYSQNKLAEWHEDKFRKGIKDQFLKIEKVAKGIRKRVSSLKDSISFIDESKITIAEHSLKELEPILSDLELQKDKINSEYEDKENVISKNIQILKTELSKFENKYDYSRQLLDLESEKQQYRKDEERIKKELQALEISIGTKKNKLEDLNKNLHKSTKIEKNVKKLEKEVSYWDFIQIQTGKKGLQAIEIENAVPLIVENANNLLQQTYGNEFSLNIQTKCEETGKEIFKIIAICNDGTEDNFGNKSGGERVYLTKALSLGMSLISKNKSGFVFDSAFADEEDSALDSVNAASFIQLYRAFLKLGQFQNIFYISHRDESIEVADHEINFSEKGIKVI